MVESVIVIDFALLANSQVSELIHYYVSVGKSIP